MSGYTSSLLAHFVGWATRNEDDRDAKDFATLTRILSDRCLSAHAATHTGYRCNEGYPGQSIDRGVLFTSGRLVDQSSVCFCDIPHGALEIHVSKYGHFGLAFEKSFLVPKGATPAFYVATDSLGLIGLGRGAYFDVRLGDYFAMKDIIERDREGLMKQPHSREFVECFERVASFLEFTVIGLLKPFDSRLPDSDPQNVYMEREWRVLGDVSFTLANVAAVYAPRGYTERIERAFPELRGRIAPA